MAPRKPKKPRRDWYSISVDTLRGWAVLLCVAALLGAGYLAFMAWQRHSFESQSWRLIGEDQALILRLQNEEKLGDYRGDYDLGVQSFQQATAEYRRSEFSQALSSARRSHNVLQSLLDALISPGSGGQARFIAIQGEVEYRRGEGGSWEEARSRVPLRAGDYVRTSGSGSADIMFTDGTLYTVRANTQFIVAHGGGGDAGGGGGVGGGGGSGGGGQAIQMEYGWVDLNTASRGSEVKTPGAVARVKEDSEAFVAIDKESSRGRFGAVRGGMELATRGGLTRQVNELQQVVQTGDLLSRPERLPRRPEPLAPAENLEVDLDSVQTLVLSWSPVPNTARYALQVSRNHLFVDNLVSVENRTRTRATLGLRGEGGDRQIEGATVGLTHVIGLGSACGVHILEKAAA